MPDIEYDICIITSAVITGNLVLAAFTVSNLTIASFGAFLALAFVLATAVVAYIGFTGVNSIHIIVRAFDQLNLEMAVAEFRIFWAKWRCSTATRVVILVGAAILLPTTWGSSLIYLAPLGLDILAAAIVVYLERVRLPIHTFESLRKG